MTNDEAGKFYILSECEVCMFPHVLNVGNKFYATEKVRDIDFPVF